MQLDKHEVADFKYDNSFLKISAQKYLSKVFLIPNLGIYIISQNFTMRQIWGCRFQIFKPQNMQIQHFWSQIKGFFFCTKLFNKANWRALILNMTMIFLNYCPKYPNKAFLVSYLIILIFAWNIAIRQIGGQRWLQIWQQFFNFPAQRPKENIFRPRNMFFALDETLFGWNVFPKFEGVD